VIIYYFVLKLIIIHLGVKSKRVVCYYTNWAQYRQGEGKYFPEDIDPYLCSHVMFSFAKLTNSQLDAFEWNDKSTEWSKGLYERVIDLKKINPKLKVMLAVGGWNLGSGPFSDMVTDQTLRQKFVRTAVDYLILHKFDGLDLELVFKNKFYSFSFKLYKF